MCADVIGKLTQCDHRRGQRIGTVSDHQPYATENSSEQSSNTRHSGEMGKVPDGKHGQASRRSV